MTDYNNKIRALILAALMVFSVFAGTVAFAGTAAADNPTLSNVDSSVQAGNDLGFTVQDSGSGAVNATVWIDEDTDGVLDSGEANTTIASGSFGASTLTVPSGLSEGTYTLAATDNTSSPTSADVTTTFTVDNTGPTLRKATHYVDSDNGSVIELAFTESIAASSVPSSVTVGFENGSTTSITDIRDNDSDARIELNTSGSVYNNILNVTIAEDTFADAQGNAVSDDDYDVTFAPSTVDTATSASSDFESFVGSNVAIEGNVGDSFDIDGPSVDTTRGTGTGSEVYVLNTDGFDTGDYNITNNDQNTDNVLDLSSLGLSVEADETSFTTDEDVTATVTADTIDREITADLLDADGDVVESTTATIGADGDATVDFGTQEDTGNYSIEVTDVNTQVTATTDEFTVEEAATGAASLPGTVEVPQGDIAEITVSLTASEEGSLVIGDDESAGYQANISFVDEDDDGEVTILFNTYTAGTGTTSGDGIVVDAAGDDTATLQNPTAENNFIASGVLLDDGEYEVAASTETGTDRFADTLSEPSDLGTLFIGERSTDSMQLWTVPGSVSSFDVNDDGETTADDVTAGVEAGVITQDDTIATGDYVVHQISASGLSGLIDSEGDFVAALGNGINLTVEQTNPARNRDAKKLNLTEAVAQDKVTVIEGDNQYFVIVKVDDTAMFQRDLTTSTFTSAAAGDEFEAEFTVDDDALLGSEEDSAHQSVNATFEAVEGTVELDSDPVTVEAADGQMITGTTNYAPGTEVSIRVRSTGETQPRFFNTQTVTVNADGTFNASFNFSAQSEGDTFSVTVRKGGSEVASADGEVGAAATTAAPTTAAETTAAETTAAETTAAETTAAETTEAMETSEPPATTAEPTSTSTPGFGAVLAVIALIGAALLAVRRDN